MPSIRAQRLAFAHTDAVDVLRDVDLHLSDGWTGLVGPNGAGKTTLLRLVTGELTPTGGALRFDPPSPLVRLCRQDVEHCTPEIEAFAESEDAVARKLHGRLGLREGDLARWPTLSPGERRRWQVGAAIGAEPDVLLLDEPTNHLDAEARALLVGALRRFRGVGLVVSHDRALLDELTVHTVRVDRGTARLFAGNYSQARVAWEGELSRQRAEVVAAQENRRALERRLADTRRELASATAGRSTRARMRDRNDSDARSLGAATLAAWAEDAAGRAVGNVRRELERARAEVPAYEVDRAVGRSLFVSWERPPQPVLFALDADELVRDGEPVLRGARVQVGREERLHLAGPNGAGKTTLLRALLEGARIPAGRVLFLPQELTAAELQRALDDARALAPEERGRLFSLVAALGVDPERLLASEAPSPGEGRKLVLAQGLARHAWALVLDEPTNHLDLPSVERLEEALVAYPGTIVLVSHDERFAASVTRTRWTIEAGTLDTSR